jgi:hypothetical protein
MGKLQVITYPKNELWVRTVAALTWQSSSPIGAMDLRPASTQPRSTKFISYIRKVPSTHRTLFTLTPPPLPLSPKPICALPMMIPIVFPSPPSPLPPPSPSLPKHAKLLPCNTYMYIPSSPSFPVFLFLLPGKKKKTVHLLTCPARFLRYSRFGQIFIHTCLYLEPIYNIPFLTANT